MKKNLALSESLRKSIKDLAPALGKKRVNAALKTFDELNNKVAEEHSEDIDDELSKQPFFMEQVERVNEAFTKTFNELNRLESQLAPVLTPRDEDAPEKMAEMTSQVPFIAHIDSTVELLRQICSRITVLQKRCVL